MKRVKSIASGIGSAVLLCAMLGFGVTFQLSPPDNAEVWLGTNGEFVTPPFRNDNPSIAAEFSQRYEYKLARDLKYRVEGSCRDQGCWTQEGRSLTGRALERIGLLPKLRSRWNADGSWNW